jgi:TusA-related sulfurtransferase
MGSLQFSRILSRPDGLHPPRVLQVDMSHQSYFLDLRGVACPMNFVKTKLYIDKMPAGETVQVLLDDGEPVESVSESITAEGHEITMKQQQPDGHYSVLIRKAV